ncbi:Phosphoheptose isomerase [Dissostichus eleginoides]|uniref:Phosphoheptose isomerase n=1 Tax=Dissostichus eleginoides TaxID=100907 RepID=A0AAD9F558_DISEL|nr:Phosphoheptose isomerase [Dissostichus eleginoides]
MERGREQDHAAFNAWKYRHLVKSDKNISVRCTLCVGRKLLSTAKNSTSNLSKHLASRHRNVKLIEKPPDPPTDMTAAATTSNSTGQTSDGPSPAKQVKIDLRATGLSAAELKKLVAGYIVEDMLPISTVDSESFRRIVEKIPTKSGVKLPQRKSFAGYLEREYDIMDANLKATIGECLNEREYQFLKEYCTVMKSLTVALDILKGDECTYGALLPTLTSLMSKTLALKDDLSRMTASLPDVIVKAIKTRFDAVLDSQEGLLAAATCPKFKLRWLRDERRREHVKELLTTECRKAAPATDNANVSQLPNSPAEMDFFDFENQPTESFSAEKEVTDYLRSGYELEILNQFANLKKMYMKYNTPTPSSAPVERLFSLGGLVLSPKRNRLSDRRFEKLLLMQYNHCFTPKENKKT